MIETIFSTPGYTQVLGWTLACAIIIGGILNDNTKQLISWLLALAFFVVAHEVSEATYAFSTGMVYGVELYLAAISTLNVAAGLCLGWLIAFFAKRRVHTMESKRILKEVQNAARKNLLSMDGQGRLEG